MHVRANTPNEYIEQPPDDRREHFRKPEEIPFELIARLLSKMSVQQWISLYEAGR